jgi:hypothetical protein
MFDFITSSKIGFYVYALINPINKRIFYIGKGIENRVFEHIQEIYVNKSSIDSLKKVEIKSILDQGKQVEQYIIRHGLTENEAFLLEAALIDFSNTLVEKLSNEVNGHHSAFFGIKTTDELIRQYNAPKLESLADSVIIININRKYKATKDKEISIFEATKEAWVVGENKRKQVNYALAEFQGIIIGVFRILDWYPVKTKNNKYNNRWGFKGEEASDEKKSLYLNKSIQHSKKKGAANPIRYTL